MAEQTQQRRTYTKTQGQGQGYQRASQEQQPRPQWDDEKKLRGLLEGKRKELEALITPWLPVDRLMELTTLQFATQPQLHYCTGWSILAATYRAARAGLAPGTNEAVLMPFKKRDKD